MFSLQYIAYCNEVLRALDCQPLNEDLFDFSELPEGFVLKDEYSGENKEVIAAFVDRYSKLMQSVLSMAAAYENLKEKGEVSEEEYDKMNDEFMNCLRLVRWIEKEADKLELKQK